MIGSPVHNFCARIADTAARFPDRPAIEHVHGAGIDATSYAALMDRAAHAAAWLTAAGVQAGDRTAILADNDAGWIAAYLGALWIGATAVPLDTAYKPAQVRTILENSGARVLFTTPKYLETARGAYGAIQGVAPRLVLLTGHAAGIADAGEFAAAGAAPPIADVAPTHAAVLLYTSGTTADPKGVVLTHANLDAERLAAFSVVSADESDAVLGVLPLFHALAQMANLLLPLSVGARVVFLETVSSTTLLEALASRGITLFACVPQFFYLIHQRVLSEVAKGGPVRRALFRSLIATNVWLRDRLRVNAGRYAFGRVHRVFGAKMRLLVTGGSKFDPAIARDLYGMGLTLLNAYGLTETSGAATIVRPGDRFTTSVGQALPGVEIRIAARAAGPADDEDADGEILIRGPVIMRGYFGRTDATADAIRDGWLHTGDLGRLDGQGRLYITGRSKEIIVLASGKNLYPEEIEAHYRQSPFIKELCVLGLSRPGEPAAERLHAVVVPDDQGLRGRGVVNVRELIRFELETLSVQLPAHKRILSYDIWLEPLPRTTTGKLKRPAIERGVRERASAAPAHERALSPAERAWLDSPDHARLAAVVSARLGRATIPPEANLELDLGLDSMERVELLTALERAQGTRVPADVRATIFTVRQLIEAVLAAPRDEGAADDDGAERGGLPWEALLGQPPDRALAENLARRKTVRAAVVYVLLAGLGLLARGLLRVRARGQEHLPERGPFIISPNHQAYLDGFVLAMALPFRTLKALFFVGAAEYFDTPFTAWLARTINIVPVDPDANLVTAMQAGAAGLRLKKVLILFPEGERSIDGDVKTFRKGAAILSSHLDAPIVPVALDGLFDLWPRGRPFNWRGLLPWRARPVTLVFGAPIRVARGEYAEGTRALREAVGKMLEEIRAEAKGQKAEGKGQKAKP
ncbi:MAG TPA: AMP-binding protein [Vicinamibacterales bacterium]|nr:AMP-binding protein [Vicinamibacterales bacterium]